jgi:sugar/nucleoside kinase (ribokinase family)
VAAPLWDVVGIGESSVDEVCRLPDAPGPNAKLPIISRQIRYGGQVATTLATCAALGLRAAFLGTLGDDDDARGLEQALQARGVDMSHAIHRRVRHRRAMLLVNESNGDRTVLWERDPRLSIEPHELASAPIARARLLHVDDVDADASVAAATIARQAGIPVTSDIDLVTSRTMDLVAAVTVRIFAEHVPHALTGEPDHETALRRLRRSLDGLLCVTLGAQGSILLDGDRLHRARAPVVRAVDATGAGDVFRGAFIDALLRGDHPADILTFANAAAALSCTREGALDSVPTRQDVEEFLRS